MRVVQTNDEDVITSGQTDAHPAVTAMAVGAQTARVDIMDQTQAHRTATLDRLK